MIAVLSSTIFWHLDAGRAGRGPRAASSAPPRRGGGWMVVPIGDS
eukprot:SAG25_NODE_33_length_20262_cov_33.203293_10_plen_45_part_00